MGHGTSAWLMIGSGYAFYIVIIVWSPEAFASGNLWSCGFFIVQSTISEFLSFESSRVYCCIDEPTPLTLRRQFTM